MFENYFKDIVDCINTLSTFLYRDEKKREQIYLEEVEELLELTIKVGEDEKYENNLKASKQGKKQLELLLDDQLLTKLQLNKKDESENKRINKVEKSYFYGS